MDELTHSINPPKHLLFFSAVTKIGGAETNILKIAHEFHLKGYHIHFACLENNGPLFDYCKSFAASLTVIGLPNKTPIQSALKYYSLLNTFPITIVLNFGIRVEVFSRILTPLFAPGIKIISNIRSSEKFRNRALSIIDWLTASTVDQWVSNSQAAASVFVQREKVPGYKITVVYNYVDEEVKPQTNSALRQPGCFRIGVLSNIWRTKGHFDLIEIVKKLNQQQLNVVFVCAGSDNTQGEFEQRIKEDGLSAHFELLGYVKDKQSFFDSIDALILPSYFEGMPTSLLEAMVQGIPIIASNVDGIPEQIEHGYNGLLANPGDVQGFTNHIITLYHNEELRNRFVKASFAILAVKFGKHEKLNAWQHVFETITCAG